MGFYFDHPFVREAEWIERCEALTMRGQDNTLELSPGVKIGQYTLRALLGRGGVGEVWSAYSSTDQQEYALKFLRPERAADLNSREAFRKEADLAIRLRSPQLLRVLRYDVTPSEHPFIVMELLQGEDLQSHLRREGQLTLREALQVGVELLKALSELHTLGLVHRDLKPSNVFLLKSKGVNGEPRAKIIDFGHMIVSAHQPTVLALEGSYLYMSPEQLRRQPVSAASDLYSVGALLFTMISGRPPFVISGGDKPYDHLKQPTPSLTERVPHAPRSLSRILSLCLDHDPARRPESADALRRTLEHTLDELSRPVSVDDAFLPAEDDQAPPAGAAWSDEGQGRQEARTLEALLRAHGEQVAEVWTQAMTERPAFSRLQPHLLKQSARSYLALMAQVAGGRPTQLFAPLAERLAQAPSHLNVEFAPLLNAALLRPVLRVSAPYEWSEQALQDAQAALFAVIYALHQRVVEALVTRYPADADTQLKRVFAQSAEPIAISTLNGVLLHTQPGLRSVFGEVDDSHLRQRGLFDLLNGYQPIMQLQRSFKEIPQVPFQGVFVLQNPKARGTATQLKVSPHLFERLDQGFVLIFFEILEERSMAEASVEFSMADEFDAPQSLPWVETREISALSPVEQRELLGFVPGEMYGEDEPTPVPSGGPLPSPELDFAPPPSSFSRAPHHASRVPAASTAEPPQAMFTAPDPYAAQRRAEELRRAEEQRLLELQERERALQERERLLREQELAQVRERERLEREQALERERLERERYEQHLREQERYEQRLREQEQERLRQAQEQEQERLRQEQEQEQKLKDMNELRAFSISTPPLPQSSNAHFQRPSEKPGSNRPEPGASVSTPDIYHTGSYEKLSRVSPTLSGRPSPLVEVVAPPLGDSEPAHPSAPSAPSAPAAPYAPSAPAAPTAPLTHSEALAPPPASSRVTPSQPSPLRSDPGIRIEIMEEFTPPSPSRPRDVARPSSSLPQPPQGPARVKEAPADSKGFGVQLLIFVAIAVVALTQRDHLRELLSPTSSAPQPLITTPAPLRPAPPSPPAERALGRDRVRLVVNLEQASFFKIVDSKPVGVCKHVVLCDVSTEDEVLIMSPNHNPRSITPEELAARRGDLWQVQLIPKTPEGGAVTPARLSPQRAR